MALTIAGLAILAVVLVLVVGILIFRLQRKAQTVVPEQADALHSHEDRVVAVDADGREITESEDGPASAPQDTDAFEQALQEERQELRGDSPED